MTLPKSFLVNGFLPPDQARRKPGSKFRRLLIGTEGRSDSGKTEFFLSIPGPGIAICLDRGFDALYDNPNPPPTRRDDWAFKVLYVPVATQMQQAGYLEHFNEFRKQFYAALENVDCRSVAVDGDNVSWELQRLAEHGKLAGVYPRTRYSDVYAARRGIINRAWDAGKIVICTNMLKAEYKTVIGPDGQPVMDKQNQEIREKTGDYERQGFPDQEYLWQIQLRHLHDVSKGRWGVRILKCKADPNLVGYELWGEDCTFAGLVSVCYPNVDPKEWGL